jgi:hypothetical protein
VSSSGRKRREEEERKAREKAERARRERKCPECDKKVCNQIQSLVSRMWQEVRKQSVDSRMWLKVIKAIVQFLECYKKVGKRTERSVQNVIKS